MRHQGDFYLQMVRSPLFEQPRSQPAPVIPSKHESSLLDWLESTGRLISRSPQEADYHLGEEEPEISGLIDNEAIVDDFEILGNDEDIDLED